MLTTQNIANNAQYNVVSSSKKRGLGLKREEQLMGWLFILPVLIGFTIFTFGPIIASLGISLTKWSLLSPPKFIGLEHYFNIFQDKIFIQCMYNTLFFVITLVPLVMIVSMTLAIILNRELVGLSFFRSAFYLPYITSTVAISMVWLWIYNPDQGLVNVILQSFGVANTPRWLEDIFWAKPALTIMRTWQASGYYMLMFLAGLQTISKSLYEAAEIDGASWWQKTKYITIPSLTNITFFVSIMLIIEAFNMFEAIFVMTEGGPAGSTNTIMYYIYTTGFQSYRMGKAAALAWILFAILFVVTIIQYVYKERQARK